MSQEARVEMLPAKIVWHRLKVLRDANRKVSEEADLVMQAIEAAPELDEAMQVAFGITANPPMQPRVAPVPPK